MTGAPDVLQRIVARRRERLASTGAGDGATQGCSLPEGTRLGGAVVRPFPSSVICEIKRRSPSRGPLAEELNPVAQAGRYADAGATSVSILTEQDHFSGRLADLMAVREAHPHLALLRKDFLLTEEDVDVAWRAGADAVLLIAAILEDNQLAALHRAARERGLAALVEVHTAEEVERLRPLEPPLVGINARDLRTFTVDLLTPLELRRRVTWDAVVVFESGVFRREEALLARHGGCHAILVGESVVREPRRIPELVEAMGGGTAPPMAPPAFGAPPSPAVLPFWTHVATRRATALPLVKICGITTVDDGRRAVDLGADILGLVYAPSQRQAPEGLAQTLRELRDPLPVPLVGVVVEEEDPAAPVEHVERARRDLAAHHLDALQLHGAAPLTTPAAITAALRWPWYPARRPQHPEEGEAAAREHCAPRILIDAWHRDLAGGTGHTVAEPIVEAVVRGLAEEGRTGLWLAGGLAPENIAAVIRRWRPELVDASSRLESAPGQKDPERLKAFFRAIQEIRKEGTP